jgi:hypothetical protein
MSKEISLLDDEEMFAVPKAEENWWILETDLIASLYGGDDGLRIAQPGFTCIGIDLKPNSDGSRVVAKKKRSSSSANVAESESITLVDDSANSNSNISSSGAGDEKKKLRDDVGDDWRLLNEDEDYLASFSGNLGWKDLLVNQGQSKLSALYNLFRANSSKVTLSTSRDMWLLGRQYSFVGCAVSQQQARLEAFMHDFCTRIYFSYRRDIPPIRPTSQQSDMGWGCVHRAGQMLLAETFVRRMLGRDWRVGGNSPAAIGNTTGTSYRKFSFLSKAALASEQYLFRTNFVCVSVFRMRSLDNTVLISARIAAAVVERRIVSWFEDRPSRHAPYSIHNICQVGAMFDCAPGNWFSPSLVAHVLQYACQRTNQTHMTIE